MLPPLSPYALAKDHKSEKHHTHTHHPRHTRKSDTKLYTTKTHEIWEEIRPYSPAISDREEEDTNTQWEKMKREEQQHQQRTTHLNTQWMEDVQENEDEQNYDMIREEEVHEVQEEM